MKVGEIKQAATPYLFIAPDFKELKTNVTAIPDPEFDATRMNDETVCLFVEYRTYKDVIREKPLNDPPIVIDDFMRIVFEIKIKYVVPIEIKKEEAISIDDFYKILYNVWNKWTSDCRKILDENKIETPNANVFSRKDGQLDVLNRGIEVLNGL